MYDWQKENIQSTPLRSSKLQYSERLNFSRLSRPSSIKRTTLNPYKESTGRYYQASHKESFVSDQSSFQKKMQIFEDNLDDYLLHGNKKYQHTVRIRFFYFLYCL